MNIQENKFRALNAPFSAESASNPKKPFIGAISRLAEQFPGLEAEFDRSGHVRHLTGPAGIFTQPFQGDALGHASNFLGTSSVSQALSLAHVDLAKGASEEMPFGYRVAYAQEITLKDGVKLPVRGAFVHVAMKADGTIFNVTSTLKFGRRPTKVGKVVSEAEAIEKAKAKFHELTSKLAKADKTMAGELKGAIGTCGANARLVLSEHNGKFDPVYEVRLSVCKPRHYMLFLVKARTGEVVHHQSLLHYSISSPTQQAGLNRIPAKTLLRIPDPKVAITSQVSDHFVEDLPDPKVLKNQRFIMLVEGKGGQFGEVKAKADGSYNFDPVKEVAQFMAVATFVAINTQLALFETLGMKKQSRPIPVHIHTTGGAGTDNAYFDPENYEIHILPGTGLPNGLNKFIGFDLGVSWHENGHHIVMLQTPGQDLPGPEGGAEHEGTGDVLGQLTMEYWFAVMFGPAIGKTFTAADIKADKRVIGKYALPPNGIRVQRNTKTVRDKTGEVHDDGEICGAAKADILEAMTTIPETTGDQDKLKAQIELFARTYLLALSLVPPSKVTFRDLRRAFITADAQISGGTYRAVIEKSYDAHGITAGTSGSSPGTGKAKGKGRRRKAD